MLALLITFLYPFNFADAAAAKRIPYSPKIGNAIKHNCANLKNTLTQLRKRDISSRVARVYIYDFLLVRTNAFATRLSNNQLSNTLISADNKSLQNTFNKFKSDYNNYDNNLTDLIATNCKQPNQFYKNLQTTQKARQKLANDIKSINKNWQKITKDISAINLQNKADKSKK